MGVVVDEISEVTGAVHKHNKFVIMTSRNQDKIARWS